MKLNNEKLNGFFWNCSLMHEIGKIPPKSSQSVKLSIVPFQSGLLVIELIPFLIFDYDNSSKLNYIKGYFGNFYHRSIFKTST